MPVGCTGGLERNDILLRWETKVYPATSQSMLALEPGDASAARLFIFETARTAFPSLVRFATRLSRSAGAIIVVFHMALRAWLRSVTLALSGRHSAPSTPAHRRSDLCPAIFSPPQ
jgi:hypothetical protein